MEVWYWMGLGLEPGLGHRRHRSSACRNYFIVMVPLRKSRGGQFPVLLGSPEDMDLEEVRPRPSPQGLHTARLGCPSSP